ncbi:MAG: bifunctional serine/threonine-protein kinase/formylglycine-generating enzyme family protein, partial [Acidobacteria bacterium]|nr:bifunctional serine/threonine-protein kinase/formylglycine-generating enzyme family protein [Acidobacteriota bacterium]
MIGKTISHYQILEKLGEGGMGVVWKARDTRLDRLVALKILPPDVVADAGRRKRFVHEAKAASGLNHPHIVTIHDIEECDGVYFIAMEWVEGRTLDEVILPGGLPVGEAVQYATELAGAMAAAHAAGIVHRDLKPANVMIGPRGEVKVLDFGLAKLTERQTGDPPRTETAAGMIVGTPAYMSPEQADGQPIDIRTDVFSFGVLLYEMLTGVSVFRRDSAASTLAAVFLCAPPPLTSSRRDVPAGLVRIVNRCLEKDREARYASAVELHKELIAFQDAQVPGAVSFRALVRNPKWLAAGAVLLAAAVTVSVWLGVRVQRARWARNVALPEAARLIEAGRTVEAFRLVRQAERAIPGDNELLRLRGQCSAPASVTTDPPGAEVSWKSYGAPGEASEPLGRSPVKGPLVPKRYLRWEIVKQGFESAEVAGFGGAPLVIPLTPRGELPEMVRVPAGTFRFLPTVPVRLGAYRLDRYEVTNREYKAFVDQGGYQKRDFWKQPFVDGGRTLSWEEAMARFRDATGRPGPATWQVG